MDRYLTTKDIADRMQISAATARIIVKANLPYVLIGGREMRVSETAFEDYLGKITQRLGGANEQAE